MQLKYRKLTAMAIWLVTVAILAISAGLTSPTSRLAVLALALAPAFAILRFWNGPNKTMSERINEGRG